MNNTTNRHHSSGKIMSLQNETFSMLTCYVLNKYKKQEVQR